MALRAGYPPPATSATWAAGGSGLRPASRPMPSMPLSARKLMSWAEYDTDGPVCPKLDMEQ